MDFATVVISWIENHVNSVTAILNTLMVIINAVLIVYSHCQLNESKRQFEESHRAIIETEFVYENQSVYGIRFVNHGTITATDVNVTLDSDFINSLDEQEFKTMLLMNESKLCIIGVEKHYDLYIGSNNLRRNKNIKTLKGTITYKSGKKEYKENFNIEIKNYMTILSVRNNNEDKIAIKIDKIADNLNMINSSLLNLANDINDSNKEN